MFALTTNLKLCVVFYRKTKTNLNKNKLKPIITLKLQKNLKRIASATSAVLERPQSQMSYLEHFLKEPSGSPTSNNIYNNVPVRAPKMGISMKLKNDSNSDQLQQHPVISPNSRATRSMMHTSVSQQLHQQPIYHNQPIISPPRSNHSLEDYDGIDRNLSFSSSKSNLSNGSFEHARGRIHQFVVRSFTSPTKCMHCTSLMVSPI